MPPTTRSYCSASRDRFWLARARDAPLAQLKAILVNVRQAEHTLDSWLDAKPAAGLAAAGVTTGAELLALMRARRERWYRAVARRAGSRGQHEAATGVRYTHRWGTARGAARAGRARRLGGSGVPSHQTEVAADLQVVHTSIAICDARGPAPSRRLARSRTAAAVGDRG
ncbi:phage integrase family protein [Burkholderia vietnamiensis]|uniref:phage integrase family protein n=1 Tax=Burkholderia vietnamiensis TaxID=60552 RepID=UPI000AEA9826|nr:phage integrase family protein [Burkholderia vietnamiensis]MCA8073932.1 hypothetical protein [Burkholderia vietnamiensis]